MMIDPRRNALQADQLAYGLQNEASRTTLADRPLFARLSNEAADMFEVAADAWEEVGDESKANIRRNHARYHRDEAFVASHDHLGYGLYAITDTEAEELARRNGFALPRKLRSKAASNAVRLGFAGPAVELRQVALKDIPRAFFTWRLEDRLGSLKMRRPWIWAIYRGVP